MVPERLIDTRANFYFLLARLGKSKHIRCMRQVTGTILLAFCGAMVLSPVLDIHVHENGTIHRHSRAVKHNHAGDSIPADELPSTVLKALLKHGVPAAELIIAVLFFWFACTAGVLPVCIRIFVQPGMRIRDGPVLPGPFFLRPAPPRAPPFLL